MCHQSGDVEEIAHKKGDLLNEKKVKEVEGKYQKSKYWQTLLHDYVKTAILQNNAKYTTVNFKSVMINNSKCTLHPLNCRREITIYNILFQEG